MRNLKTLLLLGALVVSQSAMSQTDFFGKFRYSKRWSVGIQLSPTHTMCDADHFKANFAFGAHAKYSVSQTFGIKVNGNIGTLSGSRDGHDISGNSSKDRNNTSDGTQYFNAGNQAPSDDSYYFNNKFKDLNVTANLTLGNLSFIRPLRKWQMYFFTGFGAIWSDVKGQYGQYQTNEQAMWDTWGDQGFFTQKLDNNGNVVDLISVYKGTNFTIPFGVGFKRNVNRWLDLGMEYKNHYTRSDNIDAFSFPIWRNRVFDFYGLLSFQASIKLGGKDGSKEHYDWLNPVENIYETMDTLVMIQEKVELLLLDTDNDGVADYFDKEPDTDPDAYVWGSGVTVDLDKDGVPDNKDKQIDSERGSEVDANGIMIDVDGDGVPDYRDEELNTQKGVAVNPRGETIKTSGDVGGCCDCSDVMLPAIIFDNGSHTISPEAIGVLYSVAEKMKSCPDLNVLMTGYSVRSKSGSQLAQQRINAIIDYLNSNYGVPRDRFIMDTEGSASPGLQYPARRIDLMKVR